MWPIKQKQKLPVSITLDDEVLLMPRLRTFGYRDTMRVIHDRLTLPARTVVKVLKRKEQRGLVWYKVFVHGLGVKGWICAGPVGGTLKWG